MCKRVRSEEGLLKEGGGTVAGLDGGGGRRGLPPKARSSLWRALRSDLLNGNTFPEW
ncbi:unnamed protein product [Dovyalis caffra]|uniref:Uncharacterized protein n=1 Tax=Dovyalis caffra TaxID=77055 RepID=A0AAV1RVN5_9ROSI|nr:unnamed protein product [Dovyalis caffra]